MVSVHRKPGPGEKILQEALQSLAGKVGKVGWFETDKYPNGVPVAYVAAIHEFGVPSKNIPSRSFMRTTCAEKKTEWKAITTHEAKRILKGETTIADTMELIGLKAAGDIRKKISSITTPPLKNATIAARKSKMSNKKTQGLLTKPLIDTGRLMSTCTNIVEDAGK